MGAASGTPSPGCNGSERRGVRMRKLHDQKRKEKRKSKTLQTTVINFVGFQISYNAFLSLGILQQFLSGRTSL